MNKKSNFSKIWGSALLITGCSVGAGMLGIPLASVGLGYGTTLVLMFAVWSLCLAASFIIIEVNLADKSHLHFHSFARKTLGIWGQLVTSLSVLIFLILLLIAYMQGAGSILSVGIENLTGINLPANAGSIIFTLLLGIFIYSGTRATDLVNRGFVSLKFIMLIFVAFLTVPQVNVIQLIESATHTPGSLWLTIPVFFLAFGSQPVLPSITQYVEGNIYILKRAVILGSSFILIIYVFWQTISFGIIPATGPDSFATIDQDSVGEFVWLMSRVVGSTNVGTVLNSFALLAIITSFLTNALSLFDFLRDTLPKNKINTRFIIAIITFLPALIIAITTEQAFTHLLAYAGAFLAIFVCIMPAIMVYKIRKKATQPLAFQTPGGLFTPAVVFLSGIGIVVLAIGAV